MGVTSFPEDSDWSPPPDVVKLIARHAAEILKRAPEPPDDASQASLDIYQEAGASSSNLYSGQQMRSKTPSKRSFNGSSSTSLGMARSWKPTKDSQMFTSLSQSTVADTSPEPDEMCMDTTWNSRRSMFPQQRYTVRKVQTNFTDSDWQKCHREPWDGSLRVPQDLYRPANPVICACQTPFEEGAFFCKRCGLRRPKDPYQVEVPKVINVINKDQAIVDRQYAWSGLYAERLYRMQLQKFELDEAYQSEEFFTPRISPASKQLAQSKEMVPLMERVAEILHGKEQRLEEKRQKKDVAEAKEVLDRPIIHPKSARMRRNLTSLYRWEMRRAKSVEAKVDKQLNREAHECTFKPFVGPGSNRITCEYEKVPVHERLKKDAKRRYLQALDLQFTLKTTPFTPDDPCFRSEPGTPSSPASIKGRPQRGQKSEPWRGRGAVRTPAPIFKGKKQLDAFNEEREAMRPRASTAVVFRRPSGDVASALRRSQRMSRRTQSTSPKRSTGQSRTSTPRSDGPTNMNGGGNVIKYTPAFHIAFEIAHGAFDDLAADEG